MTNKEIFHVQWNKLKDEMAELMDFHLKSKGYVDYDELNKVYKSKMQRWSSQMQPEGRWLNGLEDEELKTKFKAMLSQMKLSPIKTVRKNPVQALMIGATVGVGCIIVCILLNITKIICGVFGVLGFVIASATVGGRLKKKNISQAEEVRKAYLLQIAQAQKAVETIL